MKRSLTALVTALVVFAFVASASANVTDLKPGESSVCINASFIVYNTSETDEVKLVYNLGPFAYGWGKDEETMIAPGGYWANALEKKTTFKNEGPGNVSVNCQRQRYDRNDAKIDAGSGKTYQSNYHLDHVKPGTYMEPGMGQPWGTERGLGAQLGDRSESNR